MNGSLWSSFRPDVRGRFVDRPNRFVARVLIEGRLVEAHCPNPGRMTELLFPGTDVLLEKAAGRRRLAFTLVAVVRPGPVVIPLASARANALVGQLYLPLLFPEARRLQAEPTLGASRFDWLVEDRSGGRHLVEVKACSEVEEGTALFPDAPSERARRHLEELATRTQDDFQSHLVFVVAHGNPRSLGPNVHTDPSFSRTLAAVSDRVALHALVCETSLEGLTRLVRADLPMDLSQVNDQDAGLLAAVIPEGGSWRVRVTAHPQGWQKAVGRVPARRGFPVQGEVDRAQELIGDLERAGGRAGDPGDLVFPSDPRTQAEFVSVLMRWRHRVPPRGPTL